MRRLLPHLVWVLALSCAGATDQPSNVHDLRVLGVSLEPPEIMAPMAPDASGPFPCDPSSLALYGAPIQYTALIADPNGGGRSIAWNLSACADQNDLTCSNRGQVVPLGSGSTSTDGGLSTELSLTIAPGLAFIPGAVGPVQLPGPYGAFLADAGLPGVPLLAEVLAHDPNFGLGGFRMPLVLHVSADDADGGREEIYAQKLMVYSCQFFPDMKPTQNPRLPDAGLRIQNPGSSFDGGVFEWPEGVVPTWVGGGTIQIATDDLSSVEQPFVIPSYELTPVHFTEAWAVDWFGTLGHFSPDETGGVNADGSAATNQTVWFPGSGAAEQDVTFWFLIRNGRGGESWTERHLHYLP